MPTRRQQILRAAAHIGAAQDLLELGHHAQALRCAQLACGFFQEAGSRVGHRSSRTTVGHLLIHVNRLPEARTLLLACLQDAVGDGFRGAVNDVLRWGLIFVASELRDCMTLVQFTAFVNDPVGERSQGVIDRRLRQDMVHAREVLGEAAYQHFWTTGTQLQLLDVVELAERLAQVPISPLTHPELTPREREVLALVSQGHPDRKVARLLGISPATASKHVGNLLGKLGLHNRVELTRWAIEHVPPDGMNPGLPRS